MASEYRWKTRSKFDNTRPNKDKNIMHTMGIYSDSMFEYIELP